MPRSLGLKPGGGVGIRAGAGAGGYFLKNQSQKYCVPAP